MFDSHGAAGLPWFSGRPGKEPVPIRVEFERLRVHKVAGWWVVTRHQIWGSTRVHGLGAMLSWGLAVHLALELIAKRERVIRSMSERFVR